MRARLIAWISIGWLAVVPRSAVADDDAPCARLTGDAEIAACVEAVHAANVRQTHRRYALALGGIGAAATVVGLGFGLSARSAWDRTVSACAGMPESCPGAAVVQANRDRDSARSAARTADWLVGLGAAAIVGGVIVYLTTPRGAKHADAGHALRVVPAIDGSAVGLAVTGTLR